MAIAIADSLEENNIAGTSSQISLDAKKSSGEMIGGCSVCSDDQGTEDNPLVYCDGCELAVHQACYGIVQVPPGSWFCGRCEAGEPQDKIRCELCPNGEGALKKTEAGSWAHVVCALYIPEVVFGNNNTMEPIIIKFIKSDRYSKSCYLCLENENSSKATYGAVMDCHKSGCRQSFHVTCAQSAGLLCEEAGQGSDNLIYCGYCKHHFRKLKAGNRKPTNSLNNIGSSYLDFASDSSQDNDPRSNETENDKNSIRSNKSSNPQPTQSSNDPSTTIKLPTSTTNNKTETNSLSIPLAPTNSVNTTKKNSSTSAVNSLNTPQKKKKTQKSTQNNSILPNASNTLPTTLLASASGLNCSSTQSSIVNPKPPEQGSVSTSLDIYEWSTAAKEHEKPSLPSKTTKKKSASITPGQPSTAKQLLTATTTLNLPTYNSNKISSPNLSLSTSPSLTSPSSNSTKSSSNSSTSSATTSSTTATPSSSSNFSNSPSPALVSPNIASKTHTLTKLDSSLVSSAKKSDNLLLKLNSTSNSGSTILSSFQTSGGSTAETSNFGADRRFNSSAGSSLLSAVVPNNNEQGQELQKLDSSSFKNNDPVRLTSAIQNSNHFGSNLTATSESGSTNKLTVPPLILPITSTDSPKPTKPTAKAKPSAKTSKKKTPEVDEKTKVEAKPKASRAKKAPALTSEETTVASKPDTKRPSKSKAGTGKSLSEENHSATVTPSKDDASTAELPAPTTQPAKRKSRSASNESSTTSASPKKRIRKKKSDQKPTQNGQSTTNCSISTVNTNTLNPMLPTTSSVMLGSGPLLINAPPANTRLLPGHSPSDGFQDVNNRYYTPNLSPYANFDHQSTSSLSRSSLSRLFTATSVDNNSNITNPAIDPTRAFDELRDEIWSTLSKNILEHAQQFDIPSMFGLLYSIRAENEKLVNKVSDLKMKLDQMIAINARLDLPGPMLTQHLNNTSPNFSSVVSSLTSSHKSLTIASPGSAIGKPSAPAGSYSHINPNPLPHTAFMDRSSPLINQTNSSLSNIKPSAISTPSPPRSSLMAHSNRPGLITAVNPPYISSVHPPMSSIGSLGAGSQNPYYPRQ